MARLVALVALLACLAVAQANKDTANKGDFFIFSKSKGAPVAVAAAPVEAPAPAPCTQVCNDKCDTVFEKSCSKVPITTTECAMVKVVNVVKQCNKKCTVVAPPPAPAPAPVPSNPSTPPTTMDSSMSGGKGKSIMITVSGGKGRKLAASEKKDKKDFLPLLLMAGKGLSKMMAKEQQNVVCQDVCEDVPVEGMEKQCKDVTSEVEQCTTTPKTTCVKECNCVTTVASKGKSFMLPIMGKGRK